MKPRYIIIGAGISGLALGWFLKERYKDSLDLTIFEASERVGGWIHTYTDNDFLFEQGPRSCRSKGAGIETLQLIEDLGLSNEIISASNYSKKRFIYSGGMLNAVPDTFLSFFRSPLMKGMIPALWNEWKQPSLSLEDESIGNFISRRLSKEIANRLMDPLVSGIYAGDIYKLSMRSCFPELYRLEQEHGSLIKGMLKKKKGEYRQFSPFVKEQSKEPIFSFKRGMGTLVETLQDKLKGFIKISSPVQTIDMNLDFITVTLSNGQVQKGDKIFLALPSHAAAKLFQKKHPSLALKMTSTNYASVAVVNMGWNKKVLIPEGFGYLVPSCKKQQVLGVVFDSSTFPQQNKHENQVRLTAMLGGMHHPNIDNFSSEELKVKSREAIKSHLDISVKPDRMHVSVAKQSIAQYEIGHQIRLDRLKNEIQKAFNVRLKLLGSAWHGVSVNDCIADAKQLARCC